MKKIFSNLQIKKDDKSKRITIEGWANKAIVDSIGDYMVPSGMKTDRFMKNPIMFFNHDKDYPIGKIVELRPDDEQGVWVKGEVSKSNDPKIQFVRDLIEEEILKTFSIGYLEKNTEKSSDGSTRVTDWELHEVSVVSLPMNQDSTFSLAKALDQNDFVKAKQLLKGESMDANKVPPKKPDEETEDPKPVEEPVPEKTEDKKTDEESKPGCGKAEAPMMPCDDDTNEEAQKNAFQECVSKKIPKLIEEGKPQDQAVAIAISMCQQEGKCLLPPTDAQLKEWNELANTKRAEMVPTPTEGENVTPLSAENDLIERLDKIIQNQAAMLVQLTAIAQMRMHESINPNANNQTEQNPSAQNEPATQTEAPQKDARLERLEKMFENMDSILKSHGF